MTRARIMLLSILLFALPAASFAQEPKPYKDGPVTQLSYIKIKPGKFDDYMAYLAGPWKTLMEAQKKAGLITAYAVYTSEARNPSEPDLILSTTFPNMSTLDRTDDFDAIAAKLVGTIAKQNKEFADRGGMRESLGGQLIREMILK